MLGKALAAATAELDPRLRDRILARIGGPLGASARAAVLELAPAPLDQQRQLRAAWAASVRTPVPAGIRGIHATWIEELLRDRPAATRAAVATGGADAGAARSPVPPSVGVWLARWACATLPALPPIRAATTPATLADIVAWGEPDLTRWLHDLGADQLAYTANAAGGTLREAMMRRYPAVHRALARIGVPPRHGNLGTVRAAIARCRGTLDDLLLLRIGARSVAPHLAHDRVARRQLALRFARPIGLVIAAELAAWASAPLEHAPTWLALGAGAAGVGWRG